MAKFAIILIVLGLLLLIAGFTIWLMLV